MKFLEENPSVFYLKSMIPFSKKVFVIFKNDGMSPTPRLLPKLFCFFFVFFFGNPQKSYIYIYTHRIHV